MCIHYQFSQPSIIHIYIIMNTWIRLGYTGTRTGISFIVPLELFEKFFSWSSSPSYQRAWLAIVPHHLMGVHSTVGGGGGRWQRAVEYSSNSDVSDLEAQTQDKVRATIGESILDELMKSWMAIGCWCVSDGGYDYDECCALFVHFMFYVFY